MKPFSSLTRRFSRGSSGRRSQYAENPQDEQDYQSSTAYDHPRSEPVTANTNSRGVTTLPTTSTAPTTGGHPVREQALGGEGYMVPTKQGIANEGRPISSATDQSFDFANHPVTSHTLTTTPSTRVSGGSVTMGPRAQQQPQNTTGVGGASLSRTDQIVLKHFWESKYDENAKRDLHYLKFPFFPQYPSHRDLLPYCEIYHLVKTSPGATIISLGSANGVYIGFELATGSQLHIDLDDDWFTGPQATSITHHRVTFRSFQSVLSDPGSSTMFKTWPKPLTIEFLEEQYQAWTRDLMSICWAGQEVRELGGSGSGSAGRANTARHSTGTGTGHGVGSTGSVRSGVRGTGESVVDDGYASERSGQEI